MNKKQAQDLSQATKQLRKGVPAPEIPTGRIYRWIKRIRSAERKTARMIADHHFRG